MNNNKDFVDKLKKMSERPDYKNYDKYIPGFREAFDNKDLQGCKSSLRKFLERQTDETGMKEYLLEQLGPDDSVNEDVGMEKGIYDNASE